MIRSVLPSLTFLLFSFTLSAQINWADSTVQAIAYWHLDDSLGYEVQLETIKLQNGDTTSRQVLTYDVMVTILDSTSSNYLVEWYYYNYDIQGADPITEKIMKLSEEIPVEILTDELGMILGVPNWEEVRDQSNEAVDKAVADYISIPGIKDIVDATKQTYDSEVGIMNTAIQDAQQYNTFFGLVYILGERIEGQLRVPNVYFPDEPFDAQVTIELFDLNREVNSYLLRYEHQVDPDQLLAATLKHLQNMGMSGEELEEVASLQLVNTVICESEIHNSGWVLQSKQIKEVTADENREVQIRTIRLK